MKRWARLARKEGLCVVGGVNGGGYLRLATVCGYDGNDRNQARDYLRLRYGGDHEFIAKHKAKSGPVVYLPISSVPPVPPNPASDAFLWTYEWRKVRMQAIKKYGNKCQCCGASPATGATINVDHIKPRRLFPDLALTLDNLQVLCHECNHGKGNWDITDWRVAEMQQEGG